MQKTNARETVQKAGVEVDKLLDLLAASATAEKATLNYAAILRTVVVGPEGEKLKRIVGAERMEDRNHFEALVRRINELGGNFPGDVLEFHANSAGSLGKLPVVPKGLKGILEVLLGGAKNAIRGYENICNLTIGKDDRTYVLALANLYDEIAHEASLLKVSRSLAAPAQ